MTAMERLAARVANDPFFLAAAISAYQRGSRLEDRAVAARLGCATDVLAGVRLCRMPASTAPDFWRDITLIAGRFSLDADALAEVVRLGQSVLQLRASSGGPGTLMAARDAPPEGEP